MQRVVITGMGAVSSLGQTTEAIWERLHTLQNAVQVNEALSAIKGMQTRLFAPANWQRPERFTRKIVRTMGPVSQMALDSADQALTQAGLLNDPVLKSGRTGVAYGSCSGSCEALEALFRVVAEKELKGVDSSSYLKTMGQTIAVNLSVHYGTTGRLINSSTACTSGSMAIGLAAEAIAAGIQDVMLAGGGEEFSPAQVAIFDTLYATSTSNDCPERAPRPFDVSRDGLVIGEGAATLVLESLEHAQARGATILGEVVGFATNTDGTHVTHPNPQTMAIAMRSALASAHLEPKDIAYINAHGTATGHGDAAETEATYDIFQRDVPISSTKSYTGHTLGLCGALEAIVTLQMLAHKSFHPTLNLTEVDPALPPLGYIRDAFLDVPDATYAMSNNFAFGGINTSLILTAGLAPRA